MTPRSFHVAFFIVAIAYIVTAHSARASNQRYRPRRVSRLRESDRLATANVVALTLPSSFRWD